MEGSARRGALGGVALAYAAGVAALVITYPANRPLLARVRARVPRGRRRGDRRRRRVYATDVRGRGPSTRRRWRWGSWHRYDPAKGRRGWPGWGWQRGAGRGRRSASSYTRTHDQLGWRVCRNLGSPPGGPSRARRPRQEGIREPTVQREQHVCGGATPAWQSRTDVAASPRPPRARWSQPRHPCGLGLPVVYDPRRFEPAGRSERGVAGAR